MGGLESEITEKTEMVLLESAKFDGPNNRHTSRALGMMSEASARYIKGVSEQSVGLASDRAAQLFVELGVGKVMSGRVDTQNARRKNGRSLRASAVLTYCWAPR